MGGSRYSVGNEAAVKELSSNRLLKVEIERTFAFAEDALCGGEGGGEGFADFAAHPVAARADGGADGGEEGFGWRREVREGPDGAGGDAGGCAAPSAVNGGRGAALFVGDEDDGAVGRESRKRD